MIQLTPEESRVLGVLIEKALTTPNQYPLSLNAITVGCNQKNNRVPITDYDDDTAFAALQTLRQKGLVVQVDQAGSRVHKYRHNAHETLSLAQNELALLAELLLRGPQTAGELRSRAGRMANFESLPGLLAILQQMMDEPEPLVRRLPPSPGSRAERFMQLLCPDLHPLDASPQPQARSAPAAAPDELQELRGRIEALEAQVAELRQTVSDLQQR